MKQKNSITNYNRHLDQLFWKLTTLMISHFKKSLSFLFILLLLVGYQSYGQDFSPKQIVSPETAMLMKFENIPVSTYTGVPDINIPIYTIEEENLTIPIKLRHHSSGVKVGEEATWVGLNWDLSIGGSITQVPVGDLDQDDQFFNTTVYYYDRLMNMEFTPGYHEYGGRAERGLVWNCVPIDPTDGDRDDIETFNAARTFGWGQPDTFHLNLPNQSLKFYIDPVSKQNTIFGNNPTNLTIEGHPDSGWLVTDMNGIKYSFSKNIVEYSQTFPLPATGRPQYGSITWKLEKITLPSGKKIHFFYEEGFLTSKNTSEEFIYSNTTNEIVKDRREYLKRTEHKNKYLQRIETSKESIFFHLSSAKEERQDIDSKYLDNGLYGAKRVNSITVIDKYNNVNVKSFEFDYDYFLTRPGSTSIKEKRLKLSAIQEVGYDANNNKIHEIPPYKFSYNETYSLPEKDSYSVDHWGYFNNENNYGLLPKFKNEILSKTTDVKDFPHHILKEILKINGANRGMRPKVTETGLIKSIQYPTGGKTIFNYEANNFSNYPVLSAKEIDEGVGSINNPLKNINIVDLNTSCVYERKSEKIFPNNIGELKILDFSYSFAQVSGELDWHHFYDATIKINRVTTDGTVSTIKTYTTGTGSINDSGTVIGKEVGNIEFIGNADDYYYVECFLPDVPELIPQNDSCIPIAYAGAGFTIYKKEDEDDIPVKKLSIGGGVRIKNIKNYDNNGELTSHKKFNYSKEDGLTTSGLLMSPIDYINYQTYIGRAYSCIDLGPLGLKLSISQFDAFDLSIGSSSYYPIAYDAQGALVGYSRVEILDIDKNNKPNGKTVNFYKNRSSVTSKATGLPNIPYEDNGLLNYVEHYKFVVNDSTYSSVKKTKYDYKQISQKKNYGVIVKDRYRGFDGCAPCGGIAPINPFIFQEKRWTIQYYPIQTRWSVLDKTTEYEYRNGNEIVSNLEYDYNQLGQIIEERNTNSKKQVQRTQYTYPIDVSQPNEVQISMRDKGFYNLMIERKTFNETKLINRTSFSHQQQSNGDIKLTKIETSKNNAEKQILLSSVLYDDIGNIIQYKNKKEDIYITNVWGYYKQYPVAKIHNATFEEVATALGITASTLKRLGLVDLDKINTLQEKLPKAFITTYKHKPLVGVTSITDPTGDTTYYEYDEHNRLKQVKDHTGNVLSKTNYQYKRLD